MTSGDPLGLLSELSLGSARGGKRVAAPLVIDVVRALTADDVPDLLQPPPVTSSFRSPLQLRTAHHQLARLLAEGAEQESVALITGYSTSYISSLKGDPAFGELLAYYATQREMIFIDTVTRMKDLGLSALDELQARLADEPTSWSRRELMELAELTLIKPQQQAAGRRPDGSSGAGVTLNVKFVQATSRQPFATSNSTDSPVVDLEHEEVVDTPVTR